VAAQSFDKLRMNESAACVIPNPPPASSQTRIRSSFDKLRMIGGANARPRRKNAQMRQSPPESAPRLRIPPRIPGGVNLYAAIEYGNPL